MYTRIDNDIRHHSGQNLLWKWTNVTTNIVFHKSANYAKPHSICFCYSVDINQCVTIAWHVDVSIVVCTLIDNGEFATHVVKLLSIVVKNHSYLLRIIDGCLEIPQDYKISLVTLDDL